MTESLLELYENHTGKVSDKWSLYLREYDRIFSPYRFKEVSLLEIGIQNGGSLEIWNKYFSNAKKIIGCDINPDCSKLTYEDSRISVIVGDATIDETKKQISKLSDSFDLIIEDGSHTSRDIVKAFAQYFPLLNDGGLFIAEDLHCSYWKEFDGGLFYPYSSINFFKLLADVINHEHWGVNRNRHGFVEGFKRQFDIDISEDHLAEIHSVEFLNSICIVKKLKVSENCLGLRVTVGQEENVLPNILSLSGTREKVVDQANNYWATLIKSPAESYQDLVAAEELAQACLAKEQAETELLRDELKILTSSRSWRYTSSMRKYANLARKQLQFLKRILKAVADNGGYTISIGKIIRLLKREGLNGFISSLNGLKFQPVSTPTGEDVDRRDYQAWINFFDKLDESTIQESKNKIYSYVRKPKISIIMPVYNAPLRLLEEAIQSVQNQIYENWELCIADDASSDNAIRPLLELYARQDPRIKVVIRKENGHISAASNSALSLATGEYVALLDNDDLLPLDALYHVVEAILANPSVALIYTDEDKINADGVRYDPYFKSDFNYELMLAQNMVSHLGVYKLDLVLQVGGFRSDFDGSQDYDLALRCLEKIRSDQVFHIPKVLYHWRAIPGSTALNAGEKNYAAEAGRRAVSEHLMRTGRGGEVLQALEAPSFNRVCYPLPNVLPLVSIIIPTRDRADILGTCLNSILKKTTYSNYEIIIVDNGSVEKETELLFSRLPKEKVRVIHNGSPFNYSKLNNLAVRQSRGEVICLMNNDIEILTEGWLEELLSFAMQPEIGCIGCRLWYPDGTLQHGGVILGLGGVANHAHKDLRKGNPGYFGRAILHQNLSAVTGACLVVRKKIYEEVNGLDEELAVAFNDVDFCLRVKEKGYRNVWTPYAEMIHHESVSRGLDTTAEKYQRFLGEIDRMKKKWGNQLTCDPFYNPNMSLDMEGFSLAWPPRVN